MSARARYRATIAAIALCGLLWRVVYVVVWGRAQLLFGDGLFYHGQAQLLADGHGYIEPIRYFYVAGIHASAYHPPLFSTLLAAVTRLGRAVGAGTFDSTRVHQFACAAISACAVVVIASVARRLAGDRAGVAAALIAAIYPALWASDAVVMSESLVTLTVALFLLTVVRYQHTPSVRSAILVGAAASFAALTRAELVLFMPAIVLPLMVCSSRPNWRSAFARVGVACAMFLVIIAPWFIRNQATFTRPVLLSTNIGSMLVGANCPATYSGDLIGSWTILCSGTEARGDESVASDAFRHTAIEYARHHISRIPVVVAARVGRTFELFHPFGDNTDAGRRPWVEWANVVSFFALQVGAVAGVLALRRTDTPIWPFLAVLGVVILAAALSYGITRFRVPWDVAATCLAGAAFAPGRRTNANT